MKFSIITPLYNKEKYIADTIDSVLAQTFKDYELIIVNDSSTDQSVEIVQSYTDSRICLYTKPNGGVSSARNYGIAKAKGEIVCFLDADDLWHATYLESLNINIEKYPEAGFFCGAFECFRDNPTNVFLESNLKTIKRYESQIVDFFTESYSKGGSIALTSAVAVRKVILLQLDYIFLEGINMGEDVDLWFRIASITDTVYNNTPLMIYRYTPEGGLSDTIKGLKGSYPYWKWYEENNQAKANRLTTLMIYLLAKRFYYYKDFMECLNCLKHARGKALLFRRLILKVKCLAKLRK